MSALWNWQTCLPVGKRRRVAALQGAGIHYPMHNVQHVQGPAAVFDGDIFERLDPPEFFPDDRLRRHLGIGNDGNPRLNRNPSQIKITTHPARAPGRGRKWFPLDDGRWRKCKVRDEQEIADGPGGEVVVQDIEIGGTVFADGVHHRLVRAIGDGIGDTRLLAFELKPKFTTRTSVIVGLGAGFQPVQFWRGTIGTIKVIRTPSFRDIASLLRTAFVSGGQFGGHGEVHHSD